MTQTTIRLPDLPAGRTFDFRLEPDAAERDAIASALGIPAVKKLRFEGRLSPRGRRDWRLEAELGATVVQPCVVTLAPVTSRIDEPVVRTYIAEAPKIALSGEVEMPEDDTEEEMPEVLDLAQVMAEALALALPLYPRAEGASLEEAQFTEPGKPPMTDDDARPFAGLKALRDKLQDDGGEA